MKKDGVGLVKLINSNIETICVNILILKGGFKHE